MLDLVTSTIEPQTWDSAGGPGSIDFFPYTLDFVVAQTREVHQQLEAFFDRLRRLPWVFHDQPGIRPARVPSVGSLPEDLDFDTLIDLITSTIAPQAWDTVGGPGSIEADVPHVALVLSQTQGVHDEISRLLTLLRRSRYEAVRGGRPWEVSGGDAASGPAAAETPLGDPSEPTRLADFPEPRPAELQALQVRRDPVAGSWTWRRTPLWHGLLVGRADDRGLLVGRAGSETEETITVRRAGYQREFVLPRATVCTDGDAASIAWPGLKLVEYGDYGELLRRALDVQLPWLPHRSNQELARLFDVQVIPADADEGREAKDATVLRFVPAGLAPGEDTCLRIAYSRVDGLPVFWESYLAGKVTGRIHFAERISGETPGWRKAVLQDANGRELVRWELTASDSEPPDLTGGWEDYLHLDRRARTPFLDTQFATALDAIRQFDWARAEELLGRLPGPSARHPLARLLQAWCLENGPRRPSEERVYWRLVDVAQSGTPDLLRLVTPENFPSLTGQERYSILCLQPEDSRSAEDYDRLARAAIAAEKLPDALAHVESALARGSGAGQEDRQRLRVELLLRLGRNRQAVAAADQWAALRHPGPDSLAAMAELVAGFAETDTADKFFGQAMSAAREDALLRYRLLRRWAAVQSGTARCRTLVEAALLQPAGSEQRRECCDALRRELTTAAHAETAAQLAERAAADSALAAELRVCQAELTRDAALAAELVWTLHRAGQLGAGRLAWACRVWNDASQSQRVIDVCEAELRAGHALPPDAIDELAQAYRAADRHQDARRAASGRS